MSCRSLTYKYDPDTGVCTFADGAQYSVGEMIALAQHDITGEDMAALNMVKKTFDAEIRAHYDFTPRPGRGVLSPFVPQDEVADMGRRLKQQFPVAVKNFK